MQLCNLVAFQYLLFAILNVNVRRAILLVVLDGKAIAGRWALVTEAVVPGTDFLNAQGAEGGVICTTVTGMPLMKNSGMIMMWQ